jgi:hypothetical protein
MNLIDLKNKPTLLEIYEGDLYEIEKLFLDENALTPLIESVEKLSMIVVDPTTLDGQKMLESTVKDIRKVSKKIDDARKILADELKAKPKKIDANVKKFRDALEAIEFRVMKPLEDIRRREKEIEGLLTLSITTHSETLENANINLRRVQAVTEDPAYWCESMASLFVAKTKALIAIESIIQQKVKEQAEKEELERLRAEAQKRAQDEAIEQARKEGEEKAKREISERIAKEHKEMLDKQAQELKPFVVPTSVSFTSEIKEPVSDIEAKRIKHRATLKDLAEIGITEELGKKLIAMVVCGKIANMGYKYDI